MASSQKLDPVRAGLALGWTCALGILFLGVLATHFGWGLLMVELIGTVYSGYNATLLGSFVGAVWALVDGFIGGWLFCWIYNRIG